jgi:hypothetical protein
MARKVNLKGQKNVKAIAAVAGGLLAFALLGYLVVYSPQKSKASKLQTDIAAAQQQLVTAQAAASVPEPVDPRVDDLFRLKKAMPATSDMPGILIELSRVAEDSGVSFSSFTPAPPVAGSNFQKVPIALNFKGNYYELSDFLFRLNNLVSEHDGKLDVDGRLYSVDGVDITPGLGTTLGASLTANAYVYGTGGAAPTTPSTPAPTTPATPTTPTAPTTAAAPAAGSSS